MSKIFIKLALSLSLLIILIEGALLHFSLKNKDTELNQNKTNEYRIYFTNKIYTKDYIQKIKTKYKHDIIMLTFLIILFVITGFSIIYYCLIGRYLSKITKLNDNMSIIDTKDNFFNIPDDEMGELIQSRMGMLNLLKIQIDENKKLVRILVHDLNNSLALIFGNIYLIKKNAEKNFDKIYLLEKISKIEKGATSQKYLIDSIKKTIELKSQSKKAHLKNISFNTIVEEILTMFEDRFGQKLISFSYNNLDKKEFYIKIDKVMFINNVINNLVSNSIKFLNQKGSILIETETIDNKKIITFKDNGIGIPQEICDVIFDYDSKTTRIGTNGEKGTGFGLPLVKENIRSLGGTIELSSKTIEEFNLKSGTSFKITLPE